MMMIPWGISSHHLTSNDDIEKFPTILIMLRFQCLCD